MIDSRTEIEEKVRASVLAGELYSTGWDFRIDADDGDKIVARHNGEIHAAEDAPKVSAEFVREMLLTCETTENSHARGVRLQGLRIEGQLDLDFTRGSTDLRLPALELTRCYFESTVSAQNIEIAKLSFSESVLPGVEASFTQISGPFELFEAILTGERPLVGLAWAKIEGPVGLSDMHAASAAKRIDFSIYQADIRGEFHAQNAARNTSGEQVPLHVTLVDTRANGNVNLRYNHIALLNATNLNCTGSVDLVGSQLVNQPLETVRNTLYLERANIQGTLSLEWLTSSTDALGINLESARVGFLNLRNSEVHGGLHMIGAEIAEVDLEKATIVASDGGLRAGFALSGRSARIVDNLRLWGMAMTGCVSLPHAKIGGDVELNGSTIKRAENADFSDDLTRWSVNLTSADIGGSVLLGTSSGREPAQLEEGLCLDLAKVARDVDLAGTTLLGNEKLVAASLYDTSIGGKVRVRDLAQPAIDKTIIDLRECQCGLLDDQGGDAWLGGKPRKRNDPKFAMRLDGFSYGRFQVDSNKRALWKRRERWLAMEQSGEKKRKSFYPQPYDQVIRTLMLEGRDNEARKALIGKRIAMRNSGDSQWLNRQISRVYRHSFGYGCSPKRAIATFLLYWLIGSFAFIEANQSNLFIPQADGASCAGYSPWVHALQLMVPLPNLLESGCTIDPDNTWAKIFEILYALIGAIILALTVLTFSGIARNEMNK